MDVQDILIALKSGKSIYLLGESNSGKTGFLKDVLHPYLTANGYKVSYFENCDKAEKGDYNFLLVDEVESLQDINFLEEESNLQEYYPEDYLAKVYGWFENLKEIDVPGVFAISRNTEESILNFKKTVNSLDWNGQPAEVIIYSEIE